MSRLSSKISIPVILAGIFAITIFVALDHDKLDGAFYAVILTVALFTFFFGFATGQEFSSPVKKLLERATELSNGNFSSRVYLETKDELDELGKILNKIAEQLEYGRMEQENSEKAVSIKVKARTQALEETINALEQKVKNRTAELEKKIGETESMQKELAELKGQIDGLKGKTAKSKKTVNENIYNARTARS